MEELLKFIAKKKIRGATDDSLLNIIGESLIERLSETWRKTPKEIFRIIDGLHYESENFGWAFALCALDDEGRLAETARDLFEFQAPFLFLGKEMLTYVTTLRNAEARTRIMTTLNRACTLGEKIDIVVYLGLVGLGPSDHPAEHACKMVLEMGWPALADAEPVAFAGRVLLASINDVSFLYSKPPDLIENLHAMHQEPRAFAKEDEEMILEVVKMLPQFVLGALCALPFQYEAQMNRILQSSDFDSLAVCAQNAAEYLVTHPRARVNAVPCLARICYLFGDILDVFNVAYKLVHPTLTRREYDTLKNWFDRKTHVYRDPKATVFWQYA